MERLWCTARCEECKSSREPMCVTLSLCNRVRHLCCLLISTAKAVHHRGHTFGLWGRELGSRKAAWNLCWMVPLEPQSLCYNTKTLKDVLLDQRLSFECDGLQKILASEAGHSGQAALGRTLLAQAKQSSRRTPPTSSRQAQRNLVWC
jgi:hypothetical protein